MFITHWTSTFKLQSLRSLVYDKTTLEFLLLISTCRLGIFTLQKQRKILAFMPVMWVRLFSFFTT